MKSPELAEPAASLVFFLQIGRLVSAGFILPRMDLLASVSELHFALIANLL